MLNKTATIFLHENTTFKPLIRTYKADHLW